MVFVSPSDLPEDGLDILPYLSDDSDEGCEETLRKKFSEIEPLATLDETFTSTIIVLGVPKVGADKYEKLLQVLRKKIAEELQKKGSECTIESFIIDMKLNDNKTPGFCFITFSSAFEAQHAVKVLSGYSLDAKHKFMVVSMASFDEIVSRDESYLPPMKVLGFTREDLRWWLYDSRQREQFVLRYMNETEIYWHDHIEKEPMLGYDGERAKQEKRVWTDFRVQWSPQGSYLATFHRPGVALWGGPKFEKKNRFEHSNVKNIEISPNEEYIITWDGSPHSMQNERAFRIWRIITGELLRTFPTPAQSPQGGDFFPHFIFSHDDSYVAKCSENELCVYELPSTLLIPGANGKRSTLNYPLKKFSWSPNDNVLSIWIPPGRESPGRLLLVEIPSRNELASKNVYNVTEVSMHWQSKGDYLCLRAVLERRTGKKGRKEYTQLEIFRMREKNIPVDTVHIEDITVKQLHWEGHSKRFAIVVEDEMTRSQSVRFYRVSEAGAIRDTVMVASYDVNSFMNYMKWAPTGSNFILAAKGTEGVLLFCTLNENDKVDILHKDEHFMVNEIKWSSCGRYVATVVTVPMISTTNSITSWRHETEAGYKIWTFQGRLQYSKKVEKLYQMQWRPHPPSFLDEKKLEEIRKNFKEYSKKYDMADEKLRVSKKEAVEKQRKEVLEKFQRYLDELMEWKITQPEYEEWTKMSEQFEKSFEWEMKEGCIEEELEVREEVLG